MLSHARNFMLLKLIKNIVTAVTADNSMTQEYTIFTAPYSRYSAGTKRYRSKTAHVLKNAVKKMEDEEKLFVILFMTGGSLRIGRTGGFVAACNHVEKYTDIYAERCQGIDKTTVIY